jgi:3-hydroxyanthranilate 3,4-dioxygenase
MQLQYGLPLNLLDWAERNKAELKPPVCNAAIWPDGNYIINMVGGPNTRTDFHDNPTEEIFYQLKGNAYLNIWDRGRFERIDLHEGDVFLLPAHVIHSPQRPEPGLCFLVEQPRPQGAA